MVFLQAAIQPHRRYSTIEAVENKRLVLCTSDELLEEVRDVLMRPQMAAKFPALTPERVGRFLEKITFLSRRYTVVPKKWSWPKHPEDDHLFNLAIESGAMCLVTWEKRLLELPGQPTEAARLLRQQAPELIVITPKHLAENLKGL